MERLNDDFQLEPHSSELKTLGTFATCSLAKRAALYSLDGSKHEPFTLHSIDKIKKVSNRI